MLSTSTVTAEAKYEQARPIQDRASRCCGQPGISGVFLSRSHRTMRAGEAGRTLRYSLHCVSAGLPQEIVADRRDRAVRSEQWVAGNSSLAVANWAEAAPMAEAANWAETAHWTEFA